ncbi:MAG: hypothetical protein ACSHW7_13150 [Patiriisocius sp.]
MEENKNKIKFKITPEGSLGLLALGDIGLREWRKVRNEFTKTEIDEEE